MRCAGRQAGRHHSEACGTGCMTQASRLYTPGTARPSTAGARARAASQRGSARLRVAVVEQAPLLAAPKQLARVVVQAVAVEAHQRGLVEAGAKVDEAAGRGGGGRVQWEASCGALAVLANAQCLHARAPAHAAMLSFSRPGSPTISTGLLHSQRGGKEGVKREMPGDAPHSWAWRAPCAASKTRAHRVGSLAARTMFCLSSFA